MSKQLHPAEQYAPDVRDGKVMVCEYVRLAVERYYADQDNALDSRKNRPCGEYKA